MDLRFIFNIVSTIAVLYGTYYINTQITFDDQAEINMRPVLARFEFFQMCSLMQKDKEECDELYDANHKVCMEKTVSTGSFMWGRFDPNPFAECMFATQKRE